MIFARFVGVTGEGTFIEGKVYLARPEIDDVGTVNFDFLEIVDEDGETIREDPEDERFDYPDEVYAVVVKSFGEFEIGEVVTVDDAKMNGDAMLHVGGVGFVQESSLVILDATIVKPRCYVMEESTGKWLPIRRVDESMGILVEGSDGVRSLSEFRFAVSHGDVCVNPLVKCVDDCGEQDLEIGSLYQLVSTDTERGTVVVAVKGKEREYLADRFDKEI